MSGYSIQDIQTRVQSLERMVEFVMRTFAVTTRYEHPLVPGQIIQESKTLLDVYREVNHLGLSVEDITTPPTAAKDEALAAARATLPVVEAETING